MSKTHKITQLKKRIAKLEEQKHRIENPLTNPLHLSVYHCRVTPLVVEHKVRYEEYVRYVNQKAYQDHLAREIARAFVDSEDFKRYVKTSVEMPYEPFLPVVIKAAVMVAPYEGDI